MFGFFFLLVWLWWGFTRNYEKKTNAADESGGASPLSFREGWEARERKRKIQVSVRVGERNYKICCGKSAQSRSIKYRRERLWQAQSAASTAYVLLCVSCLCRLGWTVYVWSTVSCMAEAAVESLANGKGTQLLCQPIKYQHWSDIHQTKSLSAKLIDSNFKIVVLATDVPSYTLCFLPVPLTQLII